MGPVTRFRVADVALGWWKTTASPAALLKSVQLMIARLDVWSMVVVFWP